MTETEMVEVLLVILKMICVLISRIFFQITFFFEILITKDKPIAMGIFYRPPNANGFLDTFSNNFQQIGNKSNEIYLLRDCNINLLQNGKFILKEN